MNLKILLPFRIFADVKNVRRIVMETSEGAFGILPHRLDCVAALEPGIFIYETESKTNYIAIDEGLMVKAGAEVLVSVRQAIGGVDLGKLRESVEMEFKELNDSERNVRKVMAKLESGFIYTLDRFQKT
ncbi:F0F1 ATP synthase subunit epsilon [Algoriphagus persicinus]|uniref:F0F1 ATP synthase subunit epsilon n=1 Tax=Algoriphagus persicinus TaxID=3108754 RepID=UPI002B3C742E|nr:F0F1 ATP synthase subunit epsilon [Algoriphagus sp. E1-3-M2]MEB2787088.1 F0F1 ATP synthase subunit epsilon [Algoriphagus sp. E1-3-M2]